MFETRCSTVEVFELKTFDCVGLAKFWGELDFVRLPKSIERLTSIENERRTTLKFSDRLGLGNRV